MKRNIRSTRLLLLAGLCSLLWLGACDSFLDEDPNHAAGESQNWNTYEDARANLMGVYGLMRAALAENNGHYLMGEVRMGDFQVYNRSDLQAIRENRLTSHYPIVQELSDWTRFYKVINAAALFIEKAPRIVDQDRAYSDQNLAYDIAQARALRAFAYFCMARIWGDVPLVSYSYDNGSFPLIPVSSAQTVLNYARQEFLAAAPVLPYEFGTSSNRYYGQDASYWNGKLVNKLGVYAALAHLAAWEGNYADAESYACFVIGYAEGANARLVPTASLTASNGFFSAGSDYDKWKLIAFGFDHSQQESTRTGHLEDLTLALPLIPRTYPEIYVSKDSLMSIFDDIKDQRFGIDTMTHLYFTNYIHDMNTPAPVFSKMKVIRDGVESGSYPVYGSSLVFSRLEDMYLLRAEAVIVQNRPEEAMDDYNLIRQLRGLGASTYRFDFQFDARSLLSAVFQERRRELMGEGWRWYDMIREHKLLGNHPELEPIIRSGGIYWPVSQNVLKNNSLITQNDYWQ